MKNNDELRSLLHDKVKAEYNRLSSSVKDDELVMFVPLKFKISEDRNNIVDFEIPNIVSYTLDDYKENGEKEYCPFCTKKVILGTQFITDVDGQKCHLSCYSNADY